MAVKRYSEEEMQAIIGNILKEDVSITPIGNHELRRHLVYTVKTTKGIFVFKYYYQDIYGGREISTLNMLKDSTIKHANLIASGTFGANREWLMMEQLNGVALDTVMKNLQEDQLNSIYYSMGEELAKIHKLKTYKNFGSLDCNQNFIHKNQNLSDAFMNYNEYVFKKIYDTDISNKALLINAIKKIEANIGLLDNIKSGHLTHFDFSPRNTFVEEKDGQYHLKAILDFELCRPWDKNADFCHLLLRDFPKHPQLESEFMAGYYNYNTIDTSFNHIIDFHMLSLCVSVASWAEHIAPHYYKTAFSKLLQLLHSKRLK